mmetsp:Transcript_10640/g.43038  ORF Transcript_10640/g.43038 Transcript_10640/m.43038 type:complete len:100 (-) Transcript_10640:418-717(-)
MLLLPSHNIPREETGKNLECVSHAPRQRSSRCIIPSLGGEENSAGTTRSVDGHDFGTSSSSSSATALRTDTFSGRRPSLFYASTAVAGAGRASVAISIQ